MFPKSGIPAFESCFTENYYRIITKQEVLIMINATIVLEGGATRGVFTSGVLDYLMEQDTYLSHVIGVSAGACNAVDYVSKQIGRTRNCMIVEDKEYNYHNNLRDFMREKSLLDMDMVFDKYPREIFPFDFKTFQKSCEQGVVCEQVTTNCITGKAEYMIETQDFDRLLRICRASSSMPLLCPMVNIDDVPYLDGGLADSIPIRHALHQNNEKIVVILTRNPGYRKKSMTKGMAKLYRRAYGKYPEAVKTMIRRNYMYNKELELIEKLEHEGRIFVLRPLVPTVSRLEQDCDVLREFYEHGYHLMKRNYENLMKYLEN